jgi:hypothetical protein
MLLQFCWRGDRDGSERCGYWLDQSLTSGCNHFSSASRLHFYKIQHLFHKFIIYDLFICYFSVFMCRLYLDLPSCTYGVHQWANGVHMWYLYICSIRSSNVTCMYMITWESFKRWAYTNKSLLYMKWACFET